MSWFGDFLATALSYITKINSLWGLVGLVVILSVAVGAAFIFAVRHNETLAKIVLYSTFIILLLALALPISALVYTIIASHKSEQLQEKLDASEHGEQVLRPLDAGEKDVLDKPADLDIQEEVNKIEKAAPFYVKAGIRTFEPAAHLAGRYSYLMHENETAGTLIEAAASLRKTAEIASDLGVVYFRREDYRAAESEFLTAHHLAPDFPNPLNGLGTIALERANKARNEENERAHIEEAIAFLVEATRVDPTYWKAYLNLGVAYRQLARMEPLEADAAQYRDMARDAYLTAEEYAPESASVHYNLGLLASDQGDLTSAEQLYRKALECDPRQVRALNNLAMIIVDNPERDVQEAVEFAERAVLLSGDRPLYSDTLARAYWRAGEYDKARQTAQQALTKAQEEGQETEEVIKTITELLASMNVGPT